MKADPSRTLTLRRGLCAELRRRFAKLKLALAARVTANESFEGWLRTQFDAVGLTDEQLWQRYVEHAYRKGTRRAYEDARPTAPREARDDFLDRSFRQPVAVERVKRMAAGAMHYLDNALGMARTRMVRTMVNGTAGGASPKELASELRQEADLARSRAETIARTELVRAHAEGQLDAFQSMGVSELGVDVEFLATGDACEDCQDLNGAVFTVEEARGILPVHPNCRCAFVPTSAAFNEGADCGTGSGGFQPGNTCAHGQAKTFTKVGKAEHERAADVEKEVAGAVGGVWLEDNEPSDVNVGEKHALEVKSLLKGKKHGITVHDDALLRKVRYAKAMGAQYHTVVVDERKTFDGGEHADKYSGHRVYYKRGSGKYTLSKMHPVESMAELRRLMEMPEKELPAAARGTLPKGEAVKKLKAAAEKAHASRLRKDRARKKRLREEAARGS